MKTYILGNSGFAHEVFDQIFLQNARDDFGGFITLKGDEAFMINENGINPFNFPSESRFIIGIGNKTWRAKFLSIFSNNYELTDKHFPNVYARNSHISKIATAGIGNLFCSFSMLNANAKIGNFNCINIYASINHDCVVGDHNIFSPYSGVMGHTKIGNHNFLGTHSTIVPKITIGNENTISSGECLFDHMKNREFFQSGIIVKKP